MVAPSAPAELFDFLWKGVWNAAFELAPFGVRVDRFETNGHDLTAQKRLLANLRERPPAALAIAPAHVSALDREIAILSDMKVPVVTFHTDAPVSGRSLYVGTDPWQSGALAGEVLGRLMGGCGTVASFPGALETEHLKQRYMAFRGELKRNFPGIRELVSHAGYNGLGEAVERVIHQSDPAEGIYVGCSRSDEVAQVLAASGKKIPLVGFDLTERSHPYLVDGTVSALIDEKVYQQGYLALHQAFEAVGWADSESNIPGYLQASVMLRANSSGPEALEPSAGGFEALIRILSNRIGRYQGLLKEANAEITRLSETDPLTGLLNRSKFEEQLSARVRDQGKLGLLMIGLDGFERSKTSIGQPVSDEAMKSVARSLRMLSRPEDDCARIATDEFCILMPGADTNYLNAARERILSAIARTVIAPQTLNLNLRVSAGAACLPEDASNAEDLLVKADNALYAHKRALAGSLPPYLVSSREPRVPSASRSGDRFQA